MLPSGNLLVAVWVSRQKHTHTLSNRFSTLQTPTQGPGCVPSGEGAVISECVLVGQMLAEETAMQPNR